MMSVLLIASETEACQDTCDAASADGVQVLPPAIGSDEENTDDVCMSVSSSSERKGNAQSGSLPSSKAYRLPIVSAACCAAAIELVRLLRRRLRPIVVGPDNLPARSKNLSFRQRVSGLDRLTKVRR
jgi:hypothetical protein